MFDHLILQGSVEVLLFLVVDWHPRRVHQAMKIMTTLIKPTKAFDLQKSNKDSTWVLLKW
jgi:hypothetical protein